MIDFKQHIVKIQDGCSQRCSYCLVRHFRGPVICFSYEDICEQIRYFQKESSNRNNTIKLAGINTIEYNHSSVGNLLDLFKRLLKDFPDLYFSVDNINPFNTKLLLELIDLIASEDHLLNLLFVCSQSASDKILKQMHRPYTSEVLRKVFSYGQEKGVEIFTEIIVGFPGETDEDFQKTYDFLKEYKLKFYAHVFSARPGTEAAELPDRISDDVILKRQRALEKLYDENQLGKE